MAIVIFETWFQHFGCKYNSTLYFGNWNYVINVVYTHTHFEVIGTATDDQVVRLAGSCVLERQKGPILGWAALAHLGSGLAGFGQRDGLNMDYKK